MLDTTQFTNHVIQPVLLDLGLYSKAAEELLLGTAIQESRLKYLVQIGGGPALGVYQMEIATEFDIIKNYSQHKPRLHKKMMAFPRYAELYGQIQES